MPLDSSTGATQDSDWERRQKHATFYQTMLAAVQQAAISSNTTVAIVLTLGVAMAKFSGVAAGQDWTVLTIAVVAWLAVTLLLTVSFSRSAVRIEVAYLKEQGELFPASAPYRLESFLLSFARKNRWLVRRRAG